MDDVVEDDLGSVPTVGEKLRAAREAKGLSIEEIAAQTRIPTRHLENLELSQWDQLPAPTYTMGFAKNYAQAVGLDRAEIADELRAEMGGVRPAAHFQPDVFEPADPKRVMPKGLVLGALAALVLVALLLSWLANREPSSDAAPPVDNEVAVAPPAASPPVAANQVAITAAEAAWVDIRDGVTILKQGELAAGESFAVPATATAPTLSTAKPEALRIMVGSATAPAIGEAGKKVDKVSLLPADLMKGPAVAAAPPAAAPSNRPAARPAPRRSTPRPATPPPPAPVVISPAPTTTTNNSAG